LLSAFLTHEAVVGHLGRSYWHRIPSNIRWLTLAECAGYIRTDSPMQCLQGVSRSL